MSCYGCACDHCLYNAELEAWYITPGEVQNAEDICFCMGGDKINGQITGEHQGHHHAGR